MSSAEFCAYFIVVDGFCIAGFVNFIGVDVLRIACFALGNAGFLYFIGIGVFRMAGFVRSEQYGALNL